MKALVFNSGAGKIPRAFYNIFTETELEDFFTNPSSRINEDYLNRIRYATKPVSIEDHYKACKDDKDSLFIGTDWNNADKTNEIEVYYGWGSRKPAMFCIEPVKKDSCWTIVDMYSGGGEKIVYFSKPDEFGCMKRENDV